VTKKANKDCVNLVIEVPRGVHDSLQLIAAVEDTSMRKVATAALRKGLHLWVNEPSFMEAYQRYEEARKRALAQIGMAPTPTPP
jgi:hypothetical protein